MLKTIGFMLSFALISNLAVASDIKLPIPDKTSKTTLIQALENRHSDHAFSDKDIDDKTLSSILWAAYGVNRADGKRTIPTAKNAKDLSVYVFNKKGVFLYDADENVLKEVSNENYLNLFNKQDYMKTVPVVLVYTGSQNDYAVMHAGSAYQNVELYTAANNMASIVRGFFDREKVSEVLNLSEGDRVIISQAIGWKE
ncbi:MAG: SagB/ThcOx family dehydrogenase [Alphaproteobacteria bacterium]|nr:SagB/ThcOx family dehydrogenase [Alphaproteobacteria bacterium]